MKLKASKCQLFRQEVNFLGHVISKHEISADPENVRTMANWPRPRNLQKLRTFIGLCFYYSRFVQSFVDIAKPLHKLTEKGKSFNWSIKQDAALRSLKERLISSPILALPIDDGDYVLDTDISAVSLEAVFQQKQNDKLRVIAYASRVLTSAERNYSTTKRELLGFVYGLKHFLLGHQFQVRLDQSAQTYLRKTPEVMGQLARWLDFIEEYDFVISHRAETLHGKCDALSRRPQEYKEEAEISLVKDDYLNCRQVGK